MAPRSRSFSLEPLDEIDLKTLSELQRHARLTILELSSRVSLSLSPCLVRVRALEEAGVVERHVKLLNPRAVGLGVSLFVHVSLERQGETALEAFEAAAERMYEGMECCLTTGDADHPLGIVVATSSNANISSSTSFPASPASPTSAPVSR